MLDRDLHPRYPLSVASSTVPEAVYAGIGRRIEFLRNERGFSQNELGGRLRHPLTRAAISNMEGGRQRVLAHVLIEIAEVLKVQPSDLLPTLPSEQPVTSLDLVAKLAAQGLPADTAALVARLARAKR